MTKSAFRHPMSVRELMRRRLDGPANVPDLCEILVVQWSEHEQRFRIEDLGDVIDQGLVLFHSQIDPRWVTVAIANTWEEAEHYIADLTLERRFREPNRQLH